MKQIKKIPEISIPFNRVTGKCYLAFGDALNESPAEWSQKGPNRFYFLQAYDAKKSEYYDVPPYATKMGHAGKGKGKDKSVTVTQKTELPPIWDKIDRPLRCLDVFAGCGGLSEGLHQSGVAETKWAVSSWFQLIIDITDVSVTYCRITSTVIILNILHRIQVFQNSMY